MTNEEAWNRIDSIIAKYEIDDEYVTIINDKDYDALRMARKILESQPCEGMRDATEEERKSTKDYIDSISKPTGLQFDDIYEELDFVQPHKKISVKLRLCEDCISREDAIDTAIEAVDEWDGGCNTNRATMIYKAIKNLPSVTPSRSRGKWIHWTDDYKDYVTCSCCEYGEEGEVLLSDKTPFCPICGADMREGEDEE